MLHHSEPIQTKFRQKTCATNAFLLLVGRPLTCQRLLSGGNEGVHALNCFRRLCCLLSHSERLERTLELIFMQKALPESAWTTQCEGTAMRSLCGLLASTLGTNGGWDIGKGSTASH
jgi:hypothetical protein